MVCMNGRRPFVGISDHICDNFEFGVLRASTVIYIDRIQVTD
jgi:hypothetical protein